MPVDYGKAHSFYEKAAAVGPAADLPDLPGGAAWPHYQLGSCARACSMLVPAAARDVPIEEWLQQLTNAAPGFMNQEGQGMPIDFDKARRHYEKAASVDFVGAFDALAHLYLNGMGVPKSRKRAKYYFEKAAKQGYSPAQEQLAKLRKESPGMDTAGTSDSSTNGKKKKKGGKKNGSSSRKAQ